MIDKILHIIGWIIVGFILGYIISNKDYNFKETEYITPVERIVYDTIYINRDSIIYRNKYINIIKYDTIEKIYKLVYNIMRNVNRIPVDSRDYHHFNYISLRV